MTVTEPARTDLVTVTIDGHEVSVAPGTLVIRAAEQVGIEIPRFCDHPLLAPVGACRQCLVEVALPGPDGEPRTMMGPPGRIKPQASCTLVVSPGMVVNTQLTSPVAEKAQRGVMESLLINHPLDCPVCDKGGECPLQNQAISHGQGESRFVGEIKRTFPKPINISAQVLLDRERCILCARCTRFSDQISGDPFIALVERGALQQVGIYEKEPYDSYFSGNVIQICPVGALTSANYRFRARPFDLVSVPSVAEHDACGAAIRVDHRRGKVVRRLAGNDPEVNQEWITDKDRFAFGYAQAADRLTQPLVRQDGALVPVSWPYAVAFAARGLAAQTGQVGVFPGGRLAVEDAYAYSKFARVTLGTNNVDFRSRSQSPEEAQFLAWGVAGRQSGVTYTDLDSARHVVLVGLEPEDEAGTIFLRLRQASRLGVSVTTIAPVHTRGSQKLGAQWVPTLPGREAAVLADLARTGDLDADAVILVGERLANQAGGLSAVAEIAEDLGARWAWVPRRAGDRGAVEAGLLPHLLPGGRPVSDPDARADLAADWGVELPGAPGMDLQEFLAAILDGEATGLVLGGVELDDLPDPAAARAALEAAAFVVSLELRESDVHQYADVVFPVAAVTEKAGTFLTWDDRTRAFAQVFEAQQISDLRVLAGIAEELGRPLGWRDRAVAGHELAGLGTWDGARLPAPTVPAASASSAGSGDLTLVTWKQMLDDARGLDHSGPLRSTGRGTYAMVSEATSRSRRVSGSVELSGPRGSAVVPLVVGDVVDGVVFVPSNNDGLNLARDLGVQHGDSVSLKGAE